MDQWATVLLSGAGGAVGGVLAGFGLTTLQAYCARRARRKAHFGAIEVEIEYCRKLAHTYAQDGIKAPLYRLPLLAYAHALPQLLADGALDRKSVEALVDFFNEAQTVNRGLDQADAARDDPLKLDAEVNRLGIKARRLAGELYDAAKQATRPYA